MDGTFFFLISEEQENKVSEKRYFMTELGAPPASTVKKITLI